MSLPLLAADLVGAGLASIEMLVEYRLPLTSKRADVVLAGNSSRTGDPAYMVVELKQWSHAHRFEDSDVLVTVPAYGARPVTHPLEQVRDYCNYLTDFTAVLSQQAREVVGVAYLHNARVDGVRDILVGRSDPRTRIFTAERRGDFVSFLQGFFAPTSGAVAADELLSSRIGPSKQLMRLAADEVQRREMFVLLDEQRAAYNCVMHAVTKARQENTKTAVIVSGGPGSGKSVIALSVFGELARQGRSVIHATGSQSFTTTLRKVAARGSPRVRRVFQYFNSFTLSEPNEIECLILDEAHRIRETSANRFTRTSLRTGRTQIEELLSAARVPVFLLDENQVVRPGELGTVTDITAAAEERGIAVTHIDLHAQFRCGGSLEFLDWVERLLDLRPGGPRPWSDEEGSYVVRSMSSPEELEAWLRSRQAEGYGARLTAGYCWRWSDPRPDGSLISDVEIGGWLRPWNVKGERGTGGAPPAALWASDPAGFEQVGCIYTAQGFEYDFAGVILGPDLVRRGGQWVADRFASKDPALIVRHKYPTSTSAGW